MNYQQIYEALQTTNIEHLVVLKLALRNYLFTTAIL